MSEGPQTIGPYRILEELGHGGMGVVFRAMHLQSGQIAALKTVAMPREGMLRSIRREIHALASIDHPGVVRILDEGVHEGLPWYAMELLDGLPLRRYRDWLVAEALPPPEAPIDTAAAGPPMTPTRWWTESLGVSAAPPPSSGLGAGAPRSPTEGPARALPRRTLIQVLTLVRRLCASLAYLHGEGIVHRDLKPGNILVTGSREWGVGSREPDNAAHPTADCLLPTALSTPFPVIVDFGLVSRFAGGLGREALDLGGDVAGTVAYMAPEQGRGEFLDARADLYSLGCILYELLTGRPPFLGTSPIHVMWQHFEDQPVPPSQLVGGVDSELDALALRLLAKKPHERFGYAGDVAAALGRLGAEDGLSAAGPRPRDYLYRPGFAGRQEALTLLEERLSQLKRGSGGLVLLGGESGVGKTRLAMELSRVATQGDVSVLTGQCLGQGGQPLEALRKPLQAIADRCRERGELETERLLGPRGKLLSRFEPNLAGLPGQEHHGEPAELSAEAERLRLFQALTQTFEALAQAKPLLLILDDLHWADELTLAFCDYVLRAVALGRFAVLVVGTYRTEELGDSLRMIFRRPGLQRLGLGRLDEKAVASMVGDMLALEPPPEVFSRFLTRHSEGNPFFVAEYLRAAVADGLLWRDPEGRWQVAGPERRNATGEDYQELALPSSLRELVARRLQNLPALSVAVLDAASVLGRDVNVLSLREMMREQEELPFLGALAELLRRQILEEGSSEELRFVHDKFREVAYELTPAAARRALHRAAAEAIEVGFAEQREERLSALGLHWEQAGVKEKARACYLASARRAGERFAHEEAERLYRGYLRLVEKPTQESVAVRNELGEKVLFLTGRGAEALSEHHLAVEEGRRIGDRDLEGEGLCMLGSVYWRTGQLEPAREFLEQALDLSREAKSRRLEGAVLGNLGGLHYEQGRPDQARQHCEQALAIHRELGDRRNEGRVVGNLGLLYLAQGMPDQARQRFEQALAIHRELGNREFEGLVLSNLGLMHAEEGRLTEARQLFEQALAIHRELGNRRPEGLVLGNLGLLHRTQGLPEEARQLLEQALAVHREVGDRGSEGLVLGNLGGLHFEQGRPAQARQLYEQALAIGREVGGRPLEGYMLGSLARLERLATGDLAAATRLAELGEALLTSGGNKLDLAKLLCGRAHIELAGGRSGCPFLERAQALAAEVGAGPESELQKAIAAVRRAVAAFEAGDQPRLFRGDCLEDIPADLRRWLAETGQLEAPS